MIRLSKDGTRYVYNADKDAASNSEGRTAIDVANEQLEEIKRIKETQVLNIDALSNGSRMNIGSVFSKVGEELLKKSEAEISMIKTDNQISIVVKGSKMCKELLKRIRGMI